MTNQMPLKSAFDSAPTDEAVERIWHRIQASGDPAPRQTSKPGWHWIAVAALVVSGIMLGTWLIHKTLTLQPEPLTLMATAELPGTIRATIPKSIELSDGTQIQLQRETAIEFVKNTHAEVEIAVRRGTVHFDIPPTKERAWTIHCGFAQVEVVGTIFDIIKYDNQVRVSVQRGSVLVRGEHVAGGVQRLHAGEQLSVIRTGPVSPPPGDTNHSDLPRQLSSVTSSSADEKTQQNALDSKILEEFAPDKDTQFDSPEQTAPLTIDELFVLADSARLAGHPKEGLDHLHQIIARFPHHPRSAVAAFTVAKLYLDAFETPTRAAEYFEKALDMGLTDPLRETAMAKTAEAYFAANHPRYRAAAKKYLQIYPTGEYSHQINTLLSERR